MKSAGVPVYFSGKRGINEGVIKKNEWGLQDHLMSP
jgi:hypothetical protein